MAHRTVLALSGVVGGSIHMSTSALWRSLSNPCLASLYLVLLLGVAAVPREMTGTSAEVVVNEPETVTMNCNCQIRPLMDCGELRICAFSANAVPTDSHDTTSRMQP